MSEICGDRLMLCVCTLPAKHVGVVHACTNDGCQGSWVYDRNGEFFPVTDPVSGMNFEEWRSGY